MWVGTNGSSYSSGQATANNDNNAAERRRRVDIDIFLTYTKMLCNGRYIQY